jgi:hypothetical protein
MTTRGKDPAREIALMALNTAPLAEAQMLEAVVLYAFDQLCWRRTETDLDLLLGRLRSSLSEGAA